jgi:hypothetical protein
MAHGEFPKIPDAKKLGAVRELCAIAEPYRADAESDALFVEAMREITEWHLEGSAFYRRLADSRRFDTASLREVSDCARLPLIPAEFFKLHQVLSRPPETISLTLTSSGTTGQKSQMAFDEWSIRAPQAMLARQVESLGWDTPNESANYLLYTYETEPATKLGTAYTDHFLCGFAPVERLEFALKRTGTGGHDFDVYGCIRALTEYADSGRPVRIFGFPSFLYFTLKRMKDLKLAPLQLPSGSLVFLGGGWKGYADQAIAPSALYQLVVEQLGIVDTRVRDGFGSVEHCIPYVECERHRFHVPVWSRVFIRDVRTLEPAPFGVPGFLHFVSAHMTSVPAHSVMMGDLATLHPGDGCGCGISTPYFVVHGRAGTTRNKSCAIAAAQLLKGFQ